jgi:iron(III) transport system substrate-binding protein
MNKFAHKTIAVLMACSPIAVAIAQSQPNQVNAICSTNQDWCDGAAKGFSAATGIRVLQTRKATGEALAQLKAEANNSKTDI